MNIFNRQEQYSNETILESIINNITINDEFPELYDGGIDFDEIEVADKTLTVLDVGLSEQMLNTICFYETSHNFGYKMPIKDLQGYDLRDANGHKTYGYGLLYHPNGKFMDQIKSVWSQEELEKIYLQTVKKTVDKIKNWQQKNNINLNQFQIDAITSACFNFGLGFLKKSICSMITKNPNNIQIKNIWSHLSDSQGKRFPGLIKRRVSEANWYFS